MQSTDPTSVVWVGPQRGEAFHHLAAELSRNGMSLAVCETAGDLAGALRIRSRAVVVVPDGDASAALADAVLTALESVYRPVPVVVLAEASAFGRYYELMRRGVRHYYELSEAPERIASAVQYTAAHAA